MENLEPFILVAGSLAVACAFGWTATCKLVLLVASGSKKINARGRPAISCIRDPLPTVSTARHPPGLMAISACGVTIAARRVCPSDRRS